MKKAFKLEELDCANCAAKMEQAVQKLPGVVSANISFMQQKLTIEADEQAFPEIMKQVQKTMRKIEPDVSVVM